MGGCDGPPTGLGAPLGATIGRKQREYAITKEDFSDSWNVVRYPLTVLDTMEITKMHLEMDNSKFQKLLQREQTAFQADFDEYVQEVETFKEFGLGNTVQMESNAAKIEALQEKRGVGRRDACSSMRCNVAPACVDPVRTPSARRSD